jgi:hypothetical protein
MDFIIVHIKIIVNSLGLLFGIIGSFLIWRFGLPASISRTGEMNIIAQQTDHEEIKLAKKYDFRSGVGFCLLIASFLFQLVSNFLPP